jgi:DNA-binding NtrC family response regulator
MYTATRDRKTVLVVEDSPWIWRAMVELLARQGYFVVQLHDSGSCAEFTRRYRPAAVVLDIHQADTGIQSAGQAVARELWAKCSADLPVVVVSPAARLWLEAVGEELRRNEWDGRHPHAVADLLAQLERAGQQPRAITDLLGQLQRATAGAEPTWVT